MNRNTFIIAVAAIVAAASFASAETRLWNGSADSNWFNPANWDPAGAPAATDSLSISSGSAATAAKVTVDSDGKIAISGADASASLGTLWAGYAGQGWIDVLDGAQLSNSYALLGYQASGSARAVVSGAGSRWTVGRDLYLADNGVGLLVAQGGGRVTVDGFTTLGAFAGSLGDMELMGEGSALEANGGLAVGQSGSGILHMTEGTTTRSLYSVIGNAGDGLVEVFGPGSRFDTDTFLYVGGRGLGHMDVAIGGVVTSQTGVVGHSSGGFGEVSLSDGRWDVSDTLYVGGADEGYAGRGLMYIGGHSTVTACKAVIGSSYSSEGAVNLNYPQAALTCAEELVVGGYGTGTINVLDGATVTSSRGMIGEQAGSFGTVNMTGVGAVWNHGSEIVVGAAGRGALNLDGARFTSTNAVIGRDTGSVGEVVVDGGATWTDSAAIHVGESGKGTLTIRDGTVTLNNDYTTLTIGANPGSDGTVIVDGPNARLENNRTRYFHIGGSAYTPAGGKGTLIIKNGAAVAQRGSVTRTTVGYSAGSVGEVILDGAGSAWQPGKLYVGGGGAAPPVTGVATYGPGPGKGTVTVTNGGRLTASRADATIYLGGVAGGEGTLIVDGAGSLCNMNAHIGYAGTGTMIVSGGATAIGIPSSTSYVASVGLSVGSAGTLIVDGAGSRCDFRAYTSSDPGYNGKQYFALGDQGTAIVSITSGGALATQDLSEVRLGNARWGNAAVTIDGAGSRWDAAAMLVANGGKGYLTISRGATTAATECTVAAQAGSVGEVVVTGLGSSLAADSLVLGGVQDNHGVPQPGGYGSIYVRDRASVNVSDTVYVAATGILRVDDDACMSIGLDTAPSGQGKVTINSDGILDTAGLVSGTVANGGIVRVRGQDARIEGDYAQGAGGSIIFGGLLPRHDALQIAGDATLSGLLAVELEGALPWLGETFEIIRANSVAGGFNYVFPGTQRLRLDVIYTDTSVLLEVVGVSPLLTRQHGDFTGDGLVNEADYTTWADSYGMQGSGLAADANGDGVVTQPDYTVWADHFGLDVPAPATVPVPEPATLALVAGGGLALLRRRL